MSSIFGIKTTQQWHSVTFWAGAFWCVSIFLKIYPKIVFGGSKIMKFLHEKNMLSKILERGPNIFYFSYQNWPREPKAWFLQSGRKFLTKLNFWWCGACQVSFREGLRRIYKAKIKIFSILDVYAHHFNSSGALENKYYAAKKWLESGLLYQDSIEHNIWGYMESPNWRLHGGGCNSPGIRSYVRARAS